MTRRILPACALPCILAAAIVCLAATARGESYFAVASGDGVTPAVETNAVALARFSVCDFVGSQFMVATRFDLFFDEEASSATVRVAGATPEETVVALDFADAFTLNLGFVNLSFVTTSDLSETFAGDLAGLLTEFQNGSATLVVTTASHPEGFVGGEIFGIIPPDAGAGAPGDPGEDPPAASTAPARKSQNQNDRRRNRRSRGVQRSGGRLGEWRTELP